MKANDDIKHKEKADRIVEAAYQVMLEDGIAGASNRKIAERAGVSKFMIHYYFDEKETLIEEVVNYVIKILNSNAEKIFQKYTSYDEFVDRGIKEFWEIFKKDTGPLMLLIESAIYGKRRREISDRINKLYRSDVEATISKVLARDPALKKYSMKEIESITHMIFSTMDGIALLYLREPRNVDFDFILGLATQYFKSIIS